MFLLRRPSPWDINRFLDASRALPLSYDPSALATDTPAGFDVDEDVTVVGQGDAAFRRAVAALRAWRHFDLGWVEIFPERPRVERGTVAAVLIRHVGLWSLNGVRVLRSEGSDAEPLFSFAYSTLTNHAECGEETFTVSLAPDTGAVSYGIRAISRPRAPLARLGYPLARVLQARFRRESTRALARALSG